MVNAILKRTKLNQYRNPYFRFALDRAPWALYSRKRALHLLAAVLGSLLMGSSAFAGELRIANPLAEEQDRRVLEKATKEQPWQNSLGMKIRAGIRDAGAHEHLGYTLG